MRRCAYPSCEDEGTNQHGMLWYCFDHVCQVLRNRTIIGAVAEVNNARRVHEANN